MECCIALRFYKFKFKLCLLLLHTPLFLISIGPLTMSDDDFIMLSKYLIGLVI